MRATDPSQLGAYVCKKHGLDENPVVYTRANGYIHRRCRQCYRAIQRPLNRTWLKRNRISIRAEVPRRLRWKVRVLRRIQSRIPFDRSRQQRRQTTSRRTARYRFSHLRLAQRTGLSTRWSFSHPMSQLQYRALSQRRRLSTQVRDRRVGQCLTIRISILGFRSPRRSAP